MVHNSLVTKRYLEWAQNIGDDTFLEESRSYVNYGASSYVFLSVCRLFGSKHDIGLNKGSAQ